MAPQKQSESSTGYMPYFYEAGHYLWQSLKSASTLQKLYSQLAESYDLTSRRHTFHYPQTVEQVIQRGYLAVPKTEPETAIITDKHRTFWQGLDDIIRQVRRRYTIYDKHIYQIEQGKCYAMSSLWEQEAYRGGVPATSKEHYSLTKRIQELYEQAREERVSLWQDISRLKLQLPETAQQYLSAHRKVSILDDQRSDLN